MIIDFRPTDHDERIIQSFKREGENASDVLRRGLRSLEQLDHRARAESRAALLAMEARN